MPSRTEAPTPPPMKNNMEFTPTPVAIRLGETARVTAVASGVFTSPNPAPRNPANTLICHGLSPETLDRPSKATIIAAPPAYASRRAPTRSTNRPAISPVIAVSTAPGTRTTPISMASSPFRTASITGSPINTPMFAAITRKLIAP
ncbi:MAG: hypothetical protein VB860_07220 [Dehalococcoidia bacterium]